jgi:hypothetical protein
MRGVTSESKLVHPKDFPNINEHVRTKTKKQYLEMKSSIFCDVTPRGSCKNRRFGCEYRLHHQGDKNRRATTVLLADSCHPDDGGDTYLRNVGSYNSNAA